MNKKGDLMRYIVITSFAILLSACSHPVARQVMVGSAAGVCGVGSGALTTAATFNPAIGAAIGAAMSSACSAGASSLLDDQADETEEAQESAPVGHICHES